MKIDALVDYGMDEDNPTSCIECGYRTELIQVDPKTQLHVCLHCKEIFVCSE